MTKTGNQMTKEMIDKIVNEYTMEELEEGFANAVNSFGNRKKMSEKEIINRVGKGYEIMEFKSKEEYLNYAEIKRLDRRLLADMVICGIMLVIGLTVGFLMVWK